MAEVQQALSDLDYTVVSEELLETDYDGPTRLGWGVTRPAWCQRYFGIF